ncbi:MAG: PrsW family intramembrane metalloprotease [Bacillota bacterium]
MSFWFLALVSLLPGFFWLWFFSREDAAKPEPKRILFSLFGLGMLAVVPAFLVEYPFSSRLLTGLQAADPVRLALFSFFLAGGAEEGAKTLLLLATRRWREFDEPLDGILYGITVGLGFAALENWLYAALRGPAVGLLRALFTPLAHATFTGWLGYFITLAKFRGRRGALIGGFLLAVLLHGAYDFLLLVGPHRLGLLALGLVGGAMILLLRKIRRLAALPLD